MVTAAALAVSAQAQSELPDLEADLIHSDLPLWGGGDGVWPQHFADGDTFGCVSRIHFGDWRFEEEGEDDESWFRFRNYGVFHCAVMVSDAYDRRDLDGNADPGFLVELGTARGVDGREVELWALQRGMRPGSAYLLLARSPGEGGIDQFDVLQRACPAGAKRSAGTLDVWRTGYCAINSRGELIQLARRMAPRPLLGTLTLVREKADE